MPNTNQGPQNKNKDQHGASKSTTHSKENSGRTSNTKVVERRSGTKADAEVTKKDLYAKAKKAGIEGRSKMTKSELMHALKR